MTSLPTLVFVHAHPDDEAFFGSGAVAHYADLGHRVVLVTCTNGQLGFDSSHLAGIQAGHDDASTRAVRAGELQRAATLLGFSRVITLGYDDSGMDGWPQNASPTAFMNADVDVVARLLATIFDEEGAAVVITYDERGFYGHPDHIKANVVTQRALEFSSRVERLYYPIVPKGIMANLVGDAIALGLSMPDWILEAENDSPDELVATTLDVTPYAKRKQAAMATHESQIDNADLIAMDDRLFTLLFGTEYYQRAWARDDVTGDEHDLFGGGSWV
jgi:LmbE family N-acetylglucosaminyl deacetylase